VVVVVVVGLVVGVSRRECGWGVSARRVCARNFERARTPLVFFMVHL
jgi:hypothetical protein